ncbi:MAG: exo-alpha-sialidase, partial [Bacteroidales bacterium]|nr:exo-alpha-sialidase [Bacteroidales bacterium]
PIKNKPLGLPDGTVLYPTSVEYTPDCWRVFIERSKGDLTGWETLAIDNNGFNAIQPALFFYKGRLEMLCRTQEGVLAKASSDDFGQTWTPLQETNLQNNNSGIDGLVLKDGLRLLVCNPIREGRNKLDILGSYDGIEWKSLLTLEDQPEGEFSYPAIIQRENGAVDVSYTYNRRKIKHVSLLPHIN